VYNARIGKGMIEQARQRFAWGDSVTTGSIEILEAGHRPVDRWKRHPQGGSEEDRRRLFDV
jgi:hypothetical protein